MDAMLYFNLVLFICFISLLIILTSVILLAVVIYCLIPWASLWQRGAAAVASSSITGALDEIHQYFLLNRSGRLLDIFINLSGSVTPVLLLMGLVAFLKFTEAKMPENQEHSQLK